MTMQNIRLCFSQQFSQLIDSRQVYQFAYHISWNKAGRDIVYFHAPKINFGTRIGNTRNIMSSTCEKTAVWHGVPHASVRKKTNVQLAAFIHNKGIYLSMSNVYLSVARRPCHDICCNSKLIQHVHPSFFNIFKITTILPAINLCLEKRLNLL